MTGTTRVQIAQDGLHRRVAEALRAEIVGGILQPGDRLVELRIAHQLGVSQGPVREALRLLEREGLVVHQPRRGVYVTRLSWRDIDEIYSMRAALEGMAARRALRYMRPADFAVLERLLTEMATAADAGETIARIDAAVRFHEAICQFSAHERLLHTWRSMIAQTSHYAHVAGLFTADRQHDVALHREIYDALCTGDPDIAEAVARRHAQHAGRDLLRGARETGLLPDDPGETRRETADDEWVLLLEPDAPEKDGAS